MSSHSGSYNSLTAELIVSYHLNLHIWPIQANLAEPVGMSADDGHISRCRVEVVSGDVFFDYKVQSRFFNSGSGIRILP